MGCFTTSQANETDRVRARNMTIDMCRNRCRNLNFSIAALAKSDTCTCAVDIESLEHVSDAECRKPCAGNNDQVCGDKTTSSVYNGNYYF